MLSPITTRPTGTSVTLTTRIRPTSTRFEVRMRLLACSGDGNLRHSEMHVVWCRYLTDRGRQRGELHGVLCGRRLPLRAAVRAPCWLGRSGRYAGRDQQRAHRSPCPQPRRTNQCDKAAADCRDHFPDAGRPGQDPRNDTGVAVLKPLEHTHRLPPEGAKRMDGGCSGVC